MQCPQCTSQRFWRDGIRYTKNGDVQRWLCRRCGYRFSQPGEKFSVQSQTRTFQPRSNLAKPPIRNGNLPAKKSLNNLPLSLCEDVGSHSATIVGKALNNLRSLNSEHRVCVTETRVAKNLDERQGKTHQKWSVGDTKTNLEDQRGKIVEYEFYLMKNGYAESTIKQRNYILRNLLRRGANLLDPESVKETIAKVKTWGESRKSTVADAYTNFLTMLGLTWKPPRYVKHQKILFIPTEKEIDDLIAVCGPKTSVALRIAKETGARIGEILSLQWTDIDKNSRTLRINAPEKGSNPRIQTISSELINMTEQLPKTNEYIFATRNGHSCSRDYCLLLRSGRRTASKKLGNPRLLKITFHILRHWKGTMEYHKTKDILHVNEILGHKNINNTLIYINLERAVFKTLNDEFTVRAVNTLEETCKLLEV